MTDKAEITPAEQLVIDRLTALLLTVPGWQRNYTATIDAATWMTVEGRRIGWIVRVENDR